jgi:hypothetical protein
LLLHAYLDARGLPDLAQEAIGCADVAESRRLAVELLGIRLNWRSYLSNLPSAVTGEGEEEWAGATACLREPLVRFPIAAHLAFSGLLRQRGFFVECFHKGLSGDRDCGSRLAFLAKDE